MLILLSTLICAFSGFALTHNSLSLGVGYYSENVFSEIATKDSGDGGFLGSTQYPLLLSYTYEIYNGGSRPWYFAPQLSYTVLGREEKGDAAKVTNLHLSLPVGKNIGTSRFDWTAGVGILRRTVDGTGGIVQVNNGNGVSPFANPGRKSTSQVLTLNGSISYNLDQHSVGFELQTQGFLSDRRTWNVMLSYMYEFHFGSSYNSDFSSEYSRGTY